MSARVDIREQLTEAEERFERWRKKLGLLVAPLLACLVYALDFPTLKPEAHRLAAVMSAVVVLWITEGLPMPVTALLGACACVILGVAPASNVFAPFAEPLMFLFIGSFILARAIYLHRLDQRLAYAVLSWPIVGARPSRILFAFGLVTATMSAWMSNTATTAMMFAIGMSILGFLFSHEATLGKVDRRYATGLMLMTSFSASIGGLATPVGSPPNLLGIGFIRSQLDTNISFFQWMIIGVPVVAVMYAFLFGYLNVLCPSGLGEVRGSHEMLLKQQKNLGPWTIAQRSTVLAFAFTVAMWIVPGLIGLFWGTDDPLYKQLQRYLPEAVAALVGACLLFVLPGNQGQRAMSWDEATHIDWGVVLLYGGGFAMGVLMRDTGLANALGTWMTQAIPLQGSWSILIVGTLVAALVSEVTSNTASANIVIPVVINYAQQSGGDPLEAALGATFGCSLGFMLPVSTPCNAIVYGSGYIPIARMVRYGLLLDVVGVGVIVVLVKLLLPWARG